MTICCPGRAFLTRPAIVSTLSGPPCAAGGIWMKSIEGPELDLCDWQPLSAMQRTSSRDCCTKTVVNMRSRVIPAQSNAGCGYLDLMSCQFFGGHRHIAGSKVGWGCQMQTETSVCHSPKRGWQCSETMGAVSQTSRIEPETTRHTPHIYVIDL